MISYDGTPVDLSRFPDNRTAFSLPLGGKCLTNPQLNVVNLRINVGSVPTVTGACCQSMTNTPTTDVAAAVEQINRIVAVGGEI